ncbi:MAG: ATPase [Desulfosarcina sp.]|nr:ATPase [Desulfosarcina sp.]
MVSVDGSIVLQIVNFLLLIWILNMVLYKPIRKILVERKEKMTGLQSGIDDSAQQVKSKEEAYAEGVRQARAAGQKEKEVMIQAAAEEEKAIVGKINESAQAELKAVKEKITQEVGIAKSALEEEIEAFADAIGQKILGRVA